MITFRRKEFTIPEGHYTGPKDMEKIPGMVGLAAKGAIAGAGVGAVVSEITKDKEMLDDAITGAKYGTLGGIFAKFFINYLHKPMSRVKYQEVDKAIRRHFGVYQMTGITVGDSVDKRANINEKFEFNDRDVANYKINFTIHDNTVTMYTFGMTKEEFDKIDKTLDYYCKKYFSMEYSAKAINPKVYAYAVDIVFTNYQVICNFIMELSDLIGSKINLLDNNAIVTRRLEDAAGEEKTFSLVDKYSLEKSIASGIGAAIATLGFGFKKSISEGAQEAILQMMRKLSKDELAKLGIPVASRDLGNDYLKESLKRLHYIEGFNYTIGEKKCITNISLISGVFTVTVVRRDDEAKDIDKVFKHLEGKIHRSDRNGVNIYAYAIKNKSEFDFILKKLMSCGVKPNVFEK